MQSEAARREGFALAAAVMAMVLVGALVTGGFYAATQEAHIATSVRFAGEALNVAEHGLNKVIGTWPLARYEAIAIGSGSTVVDTLRAGSTAIGEATVEVRRMSTFTYFLRSTGKVIGHGRGAGSTRTVGMLVRTRRLQIHQDRAVQVLGQLTVGGNATVDGNDRIPEGWEESERCRNTGAHAGVVAKNAVNVDERGSGSIQGEPRVVQDANMDTTSFTQFGDWDYDDLAARAEKVFPGGTTVNNTVPTVLPDGECNTADRMNWGDPAHPQGACHFYFPIIHVQGDLTLNSNTRGQGILLVDGDLHIAGGYEFDGIVIVKGIVTNGGGNSVINGITMIMSNGSELGVNSETELTGRPVVAFSSCAIQRAVEYNSGTARAFPISERSWFDLTAAGMDL
ncbi:MAG TPA: hypothetical protein VF188_18120 [Longimicrobiales bacterium]